MSLCFCFRVEHTDTRNIDLHMCVLLAYIQTSYIVKHISSLDKATLHLLVKLHQSSPLSSSSTSSSSIRTVARSTAVSSQAFTALFPSNSVIISGSK